MTANKYIEVNKTFLLFKELVIQENSLEKKIRKDSIKKLNVEEEMQKLKGIF